MSDAWITIIGIGEGGIDQLTPAAHELIEGAEVLVGGTRHLGAIGDINSKAERLTWAGGFRQALEGLIAHKGKRIVVLASGDPMFYGAGSTIVRRFGSDAITVIPAPGAFSLAAARMGWPLADVATLTVHGRALSTLNLHITPGARLLVLSRDGATPAEVAGLLAKRGFGDSTITVLERLGGDGEKIYAGRAADWNHGRGDDLNTLAVVCVAGAEARPLSRLAGLPDDAFDHDGQITKREVRAATLAALAPLPGQVLWDIGAGSGAVAIEWLRSDTGLGAVAIERNQDRAATIKSNAEKLGVPGLITVTGEAPGALMGLQPLPDAVFVGGGVSAPAVLDAAWAVLRPGGRLIANAVTIEAEARLLDFHGAHGGDLVRIGVERAAPIGGLNVLRPFITVTQLSVVKP